MESKYMKAVREECERARKESRTISHSCARTLANMYSQGMDETQKFASSGAILLPGLLDKLFPKVRFDSALMFDEKEFLLHRDSVRNYIKGREKAGTCFPEAGVRNWNEIYIGGVELSDPLLPCESVQDMLARMKREEARANYETMLKMADVPPSIRRQLDDRIFPSLHVICENEDDMFFPSNYYGRHEHDCFLVQIGQHASTNFLIYGHGENEAFEIALDQCRQMGFKGLCSEDPHDIADEETVKEFFGETGEGYCDFLQVTGDGNYYDPQETHYSQIHPKNDPFFTVICADHCACEVCAGDMIGEADFRRFWSLRDAVKTFQEHDISDEQGPIESSSFPWNPGDSCRRTGRQWDTMTPNWCDEENACREVSFHVKNVSASSQRRIMRLLGADGFEKGRK